MHRIIKMFFIYSLLYLL
ncbi:hypothetical protein Mgra_00008797 [Meloidogyne graminicola]|uniref:Uncharacterized protein n=1 Tax=Meloidogyne graminicola TaxID=189291 RepID=A0A8S9ZES9_9BILA|nr:hypothetical protein Mgra_00008797 [Meloidogyne graminicola]